MHSLLNRPSSSKMYWITLSLTGYVLYSIKKIHN